MVKIIFINLYITNNLIKINDFPLVFFPVLKVPLNYAKVWMVSYI